MKPIDYWKEGISEAAEECGLKITDEQLECLAKAVENGHENYGMAYYSPPASDRLSDIEKEWKAKLAAKEREFETYRNNAETAIKRALHQHSDAVVSIREYGDVYRYGGRIEQIL